MATKPKSVIKPRDVKWYGFKSDLPDHRDKLFRPAAASLPDAVDLRQWCPPIMDQGQLGSCSAHAITAALRFALIKSGQPDHELARLALYYEERLIENSVDTDSGAELRDGIRVAAKIGCAHETLWPYDIGNFRRRPTKAVYDDALKFEALTYERVDIDAQHIKAALAAGHPVIIGISVFDAFESDQVARTGVVPMPGPTDAPNGGHAMLCVGYGQHSGYFTVMNSWGAWGDKGFCYIPEAYLADPNIGSDYWVITDVQVKQ